MADSVFKKVNFHSFYSKLYHHKKQLIRFLKKLEKEPPPYLDTLANEIDKEVWKEVDCLSCANCCKKMTPTFTVKDIRRIAAFLNMKPAAFKEKYLYYDKKSNDWMNKKQPCQFLNLQTNLCSIYPVRPADCAGFPHLTKKKMKDYLHVHMQNIQYCPATYKMVERMLQNSELKNKYLP
jgi:Fe-S-cluster containining protein